MLFWPVENIFTIARYKTPLGDERSQEKII